MMILGSKRILPDQNNSGIRTSNPWYHLLFISIW